MTTVWDTPVEVWGWTCHSHAPVKTGKRTAIKPLVRDGCRLASGLVSGESGAGGLRPWLLGVAMFVPVLLAAGLYVGHLAGYGEAVHGTVRRLLAAGWEATAGRIVWNPTPVAPPPSRPVVRYEGELAAPARRPPSAGPAETPAVRAHPVVPVAARGRGEPGTARERYRPGAARGPESPGAATERAGGGKKSGETERSGRPARARGRQEAGKRREGTANAQVKAENGCPAEWRDSWLWEQCRERLREGDW